MNCCKPLSRAAFRRRITARPFSVMLTRFIRRSPASSWRATKPRRTRSSTIRLAAGSETCTDSAAFLERQLVVGRLEVVEQLELGEADLERADRLEQVRVAVLVQIDDEGVEVVPVKRRRLPLPGAGMSAVACTHASIAQASLIAQLERDRNRRCRAPGDAEPRRRLPAYGRFRLPRELGRDCPIVSVAAAIEALGLAVAASVVPPELVETV